MRIRKIEVHGFKSFADLSLDFEKGLNCITGPNGHGKSNLLDAISLCLTVDLKALRVSSPRDLIFRGAPEATVSLVLQATEKGSGRPSGQIPTADIYCRIYGEKPTIVYKVNGKNKNRKEVRAFLRDIGIDVDERTFIMYQQTVSSIIFSSPQQLAEVIIVASGCKIWSENVFQAKNDLQKWNETRTDLLAHITSLERTLEQDRKHFEHHERVEQLLERVAAFQRRLHSHELAEVIKQLLILQNERDSFQREMEELQCKIVSQRGGSENLEAVQETLKSEITAQHDIRARVSQAKKSVIDAVESLRAAESQQRGDSDSLKSAVDSLNQQKLQLETARAEAAHLNARLKHLNSEAQRLQMEIDAKQHWLSTLDSSPERVIKQRIDALRQIISSSEASHVEHRSLLQKVMIDADNCAKLCAQDQQHVENMQHEVSRLNSSVLVDYQVAHPDQLSDDLPSRLATVRSELKQYEARSAELNRQTHSQNQLESSISAVAIIDAFQLKKEAAVFLLALNVVASSYLHVLLCQTIEEATELMALYKNNKMSVRIWPMKSLTGPSTEKWKQIREKFLGHVISPLDLIIYDRMYEPAFQRIFGGVVFVKDATVGEQIAKSFSVLVVTTTGEQIGKGSLKGGYYGARPNRISLKFEAEEVLQKLSALRSQLEQLEKRNEKEQGIVQARNKLQSAQEKLASAQQSALSLQAKSQSLEKSRSELLSTLDGIDSALTMYKEELRVLEQNGAARDVIVQATALHLTQLQDQLNKNAVELETAEDRLGELNIDDLETALEIAQSTVSFQTDRATKPSDVSAKRKLLDDVKATLEAFQIELAGADERVRVARERLEQLSVEQDRADSARKDASRRVSMLQFQISEVEKRISEKEEIRAGILAASKLPPDDAGVLLSKADHDRLLNELAVMRLDLQELRKIKGPPAKDRAIFDQQVTKLHEFKQQVAIVENATTILSEGIDECRQQIAQQNAAALEVICLAFSKLVLDLVGKEAKLEPLDPQDIECGVQLLIRSTSSSEWKDALLDLSGGQKAMVAIAFVLAVAQYRKRPFYLLDEVDAALDEVNSKKIASLLQKHFRDGQVIAVSHHASFQEEANHQIQVVKENDVSHVVRILKRK